MFAAARAAAVAHHVRKTATVASSSGNSLTGEAAGATEPRSAAAVSKDSKGSADRLERALATLGTADAFFLTSLGGGGGVEHQKAHLRTIDKSGRVGRGADALPQAARRAVRRAVRAAWASSGGESGATKREVATSASAKCVMRNEVDDGDANGNTRSGADPGGGMSLAKAERPWEKMAEEGREGSVAMLTKLRKTQNEQKQNCGTGAGSDKGREKKREEGRESRPTRED